MSHARRPILFVCLMIGSWLSWNPALLAQPPYVWTWRASSTGDEWFGADAAEHRIFLSLREKRDVAQNNRPLKSVMKDFADAYSIPIVLDEKGLEEETVTLEEPITLNVPNISLRSALRLILDPLNLTFVIQDEVMMITNKKNSANMLCVYEVDSLLTSRIRTTRDASSLRRLISAIETSIEPDNWSDQGGTATISVVFNRNEQTVLVIAAPFETHSEIQSLLNILALQRDEVPSNSTYYFLQNGPCPQGSSVRGSLLRRTTIGDR